METINYTTANYILANSARQGTTIYIKNRIDLGGGQIVLPKDVTLVFDGGEITNGTLRGDHTLLLGTWQKGLKASRSYIFMNLGSTVFRPILEINTWIGWQYFDTTLGKPIWWTGSKWVDATGAEV